MTHSFYYSKRSSVSFLGACLRIGLGEFHYHCRQRHESTEHTYHTGTPFPVAVPALFLEEHSDPPYSYFFLP